MFEKISKEKIQEIRELSGQGMNVREVSQRLNVSLGSVSKYRVTEKRKAPERPDISELKQKLYFCPECGKQVFLIQDGTKCYLSCIRCDWCGFLGRFSLPQKIEDLREKFTQEV